MYDPEKKLRDYLHNDRSFFLNRDIEPKGHREVRIPNKTCNINVIFKLKLRRVSHSDLSLLKSEIAQNIAS